MKLLYGFIGLLVVLGLSYGGYYYYTTTVQETDLGNPFPATPVTPPKQEKEIYLYKESGTVLFKNEGTDTFTEATTTKTVINRHVTVKTSDGFAYVMLPDESLITLATSTEILLSFDENKTLVMQLAGVTYHRVAKLPSTNRYDVRTPNTLASVHGTMFGVTYESEKKKTRVIVTEHDVEVTETKENGLMNKAPVIVSEGSLATIDTGIATSTKGNIPPASTVTLQKHSEVKEIQDILDENKLVSIEYTKRNYLDKQKFIESLIDTYQKDRASYAQDVINQATSTRSGEKPETHKDIIVRLMRKMVVAQELQSKPVATSTPTTQAPAEQKKQEQPATTTTTPSLPVKEMKESVSSTTPKIISNGSTTPSLPSVTTDDSGKKFSPTDENLTPSDQIFIDSFYATYERLFSVDNGTSYCQSLGKTTGQDMVLELKSITKKAGYLLPKEQELTTFANDLVNACADGTISTKIPEFKTRFDTTYPF
jgi:hypothetical protein